MVTLREYQEEAVAGCFTEWNAGKRATLLVMATGCGKTHTAGEVVRRFAEAGERVLWIAHRDELIQQAADSLREATGARPEIEKADSRARLRDDLIGAGSVVVASVQSLRGARLSRFPSHEFGLVVVDEAHHAAARTYRDVLRHFTGSKVLGLTATPDRGDAVGLGHVFDSNAYSYDIRDGIADGWLSSIIQKTIICDSLDLSDIRTRAGDLAANELAAAIEVDAVLHQIADPLIREAGSRQTLIFMPSVAAAHALSEVMAGYDVAPDKIGTVDGKTPQDERRETIAKFQDGRIQFLINCMVLTEGFDAPATACVAVARPTKSRALYAQMIGRGTRCSPGKTDCLILDFVGNAGRHRLVTPFDVLAGKELPEGLGGKAQELADGGMTAEDALAAAEAWAAANEAAANAERRRRAAAGTRAKTRYSAADVDPFDLLGAKDTGGGWAPEATEKQRDFLAQKGVQISDDLNRREASALIDALIGRQAGGLATFKQARLIHKNGLNPDGVTFEDAGKIIDAIAKNGWRPTQALITRYGRAD